MNGESEGDALNEYMECMESGRDFLDDEELEKRKAKSKKRRERKTALLVQGMTYRYRIAGLAKVGSDIQCACCGKKFKKKSYQSKFCRNKGQNNCKDKYWNTVDEKRRFRATFF